MALIGRRPLLGSFDQGNYLYTASLPRHRQQLSSRVLIISAAAKKGQDPQGDSFSSSFDALRQREDQLWQRQDRLIDQLDRQHATSYQTLLELHQQMQHQYAKERESFIQQEAILKQELGEARSQIMYLLSYIGDSIEDDKKRLIQSGAGFSGSAAASVVSSTGTASSLSPAEQVKALIDAVRAGDVSVNSPSTPRTTEPPPQPTTASSSTTTTFENPFQQRTADEQVEQPSYAADLQAAFAAVHQHDVLKDEIDYEYIAQQIAEGRKRAASLGNQSSSSTAARSTPPQQEQEPSAIANGAAPSGPPPTLSLGAFDEIFWVHQLHLGLTELGYFPGEQDIDDYYFGEETQSAVMTMQACEGLIESGVVAEPEWMVLLGPELKLRASKDLTEGMDANMPGFDTSLFGGGSSSTNSTSSTATSDDNSNSKAFRDLFSASLTEQVTESPGSISAKTELHLQDDTVNAQGRVVAHDEIDITQENTITSNASGGVVETSTSSVKTSHYEVPTKWPVLMEGDGGREVHSFHVALERHGFGVGEDDLVWWTFGSASVTAVKTFQACNGIPESGVCDARTWMALLGEDAQPADILDLWSGNSDDEDLENRRDMIWLIGEQRWARKS